MRECLRMIECWRVVMNEYRMHRIENSATFSNVFRPPEGAHDAGVLSPPPLPLNLKSILALASSWILGLFDSMTGLFFTL